MNATDQNPTLVSAHPSPLPPCGGMTGAEWLRSQRLMEANWNRVRVAAEAANITPHALIEWIEDHVNGEAEVARCAALFNAAKADEARRRARRGAETEALGIPSIEVPRRRLVVEDHPLPDAATRDALRDAMAPRPCRSSGGLVMVGIGIILALSALFAVAVVFHSYLSR